MGYIVTDIEAVTQAVEVKTHRSIEQLAIEMHGDNVTVSKAGTVHAKHDGYTCPYTSRVYRAGEFVPVAEPEVVRGRRSKRRYDVRACFNNDTIVLWQDLTSAQAKAARAQLREQTAAVKAETSNHVGEVKTRLKSVELIADYVFAPRYEGGCRVCGLTDNSGNVFVYFGDAFLGEAGDTVTIDATIKAHSVRDGVKQTIINRPRVLNHIEAQVSKMPVVYAHEVLSEGIYIESCINEIKLDIESTRARVRKYEQRLDDPSEKFADFIKNKILKDANKSLELDLQEHERLVHIKKIHAHANNS